MRQVAITAAIIGGALFLGPGSSSASLTGVSNIDSMFTNNTNTSAQTALTEKARPSAKLASVQTSSDKTVTVVQGDYLSKIAQDNGTTYQRMYYANTAIADPDLIFPGQQLRVPAENEELTPRPLPENAPAEVKAEVTAEPRVAAPVQEFVAPAPVQQQEAAPSVASGGVWDALAQCEAGGNWAINTGNGFYGGLQFTLSSWQAAGGSGYPHHASRDEQIKRGQILQSMQGWGAWPACSAKLGLR